MTVRGDLILNSYITKLPDELTVNGNLELRNTRIDLKDTKYLTVHGDLYTGPCTEYLNEPIIVDGILDLRESGELKELWNEHFVLDNALYLGEKNVHIKSLPENMGSGALMLRGSHIEYLPEDRLISGSIDLSYSAIKKLPNDFVVCGDLNLSYTMLTDYSNNMVVLGDMDIRGTALPTEREGVVVLGNKITDIGFISYKK